MSWTTERARLAALTRHRAPDDPEVHSAARDLRAARAQEYVRALVDAAPPLTDDQLRELARIIRGDLPVTSEPATPGREAA